jgi:hypothetical protein
MTDWDAAQTDEKKYWGNCLGMTTWGEFVKQEMYGREMGLFDAYGNGQGELDMQHQSVLDIGGGPGFLTLPCINAGQLIVADPCIWPESVYRRYRKYGIEYSRSAGEELHGFGGFNEVWIYNVLQHVQDPAKVLTNAITCGKVLRVFEWCHIPADTCHPHVLTPEKLLNWLSGTRIEKVRIPVLNEYWAKNATAFVGVFQLNN